MLPSFGVVAIASIKPVYRRTSQRPALLANGKAEVQHQCKYSPECNSGDIHACQRQAFDSQACCGNKRSSGYDEILVVGKIHLGVDPDADPHEGDQAIENDGDTAQNRIRDGLNGISIVEIRSLN